MSDRLRASSMHQSGEQPLQASIVVTTCRRTAMLGELLATLCPQIAGRSVEVIIVDNCPDGSAREVVERQAEPALHYVHETRRGVVHARNRGVAEAQGTYVIFLDDDEVPSENWLPAWLAQADGKTDASFGRIIARQLGPCPAELAAQVSRNFCRDMDRPTGADISGLWAYVGTGNAMFHKARCLGPSDPFDARFNARGGEDGWLIRGLVQQGRQLVWNHEAVVDELVPEERMTLPSLRLRRFNHGQLRCILMFGNGGLVGIMRVAIWMIAGAVQYVGYSAAAMVARHSGLGNRADFLCGVSAGAGKMQWWRPARVQSYSET